MENVKGIPITLSYRGDPAGEEFFSLGSWRYIGAPTVVPVSLAISPARCIEIHSVILTTTVACNVVLAVTDAAFANPVPIINNDFAALGGVALVFPVTPVVHIANSSAPKFLALKSSASSTVGLNVMGALRR